MQDELDDRSFRTLLAALSRDMTLLVQQTAQLGRAELQLATSGLTTSLIGLVAGVLVASVGALVLVSALVLIAIALGLPAWAAALGVGVLLVLAGALAAYAYLKALRRVRFDLQETRASVRETLQWIKVQTRV